ncbi:uncharacterized protein [Palaemon carinicauda]|uniref:uncharacterized protein isoform X1 n=1 Tax=Palaemon carinicauda TaxID=392227 RepID=UPI0035B67A52
MEVARVKLKWNNHQCIFSHYLQDYCNQPMFSDAMIACEGRIFMVHRIILSTCSHYFEEIFQRSPNDNARPVIILNDTPVETIEWLLSYMYCGEVTIPKDSLSLLFKLAEQLKVKGLSHLQVPESEKKQTVPGEGEDSSSVPITLKRKLSDTPNTQTKKSTSSVSMGLQSDSTSYVLTPSLQTVTASPSNPSFPQGVSPLILTNSIAGSLPSSSIIIKPPSAGPLSNAIGTRVLSPPTGVVPQKVSSSVPIVTIPTSALPSSVQTSLNCSRMPILANHLLGKSTSTPSSMSSSTIVPPKPSPTVIITSTAKHNGSILAENETFNFMPAGTTTDYPLLTEIKEEVKEEPLTLGPDDPMCTDDVDDDDDDFSGWGFDDSPTLPENSSSVPAPTSKNSHMVALPTTMGSLNIAATFSMKNKSKRKQDISETIKEHANEAEGPKDKANGEEGGAPARLPHVLPQIVQPFMGVKAHVQVKSKDKKKKAYQPPGHFQGDQQQPHQLPTSDVEVSTKTLTSPDVQDIKKSFSPQKIQENAGAPCHVRVVKKTVKRDEFKMAKEVLDMSVLNERKQPAPCNITFTVPPAVTISDSQNQGSSFEDDAGLREMMEFIQEGADNNPVFVPVESNKKRNQPYLIRSSKIATKNDEPVKFCLRGGKANQIVTICMRYTEEKYKHIPVFTCRLHQKENENSNFQVSSLGGSPIMYRNDEDGHPTAHMVISDVDMDEMSNFIFFVTFVCLNSCHKGNGKKMELVCKLLDPATSQVMKQNNFEVRVCKNVKRDYKEVIQGEINQCLKVLVRPDAYLYPEEVVSDGKNVGKSHGLASGSGSITLSEERLPCTDAGTLATNQETLNHDLYLIRLPNSKRGKMVLDLVREFEKAILDLETNPAGQDSNGNDQESL